MSSGICQYSGGEEFYCNRYHDDTEVTFINPYNGEQNFTFYIISDENHEDTKNDGEMENNMNTLIMKLKQYVKHCAMNMMKLLETPLIFS
jgi:hypothetical protein